MATGVTIDAPPVSSGPATRLLSRRRVLYQTTDRCTIFQMSRMIAY